MAASRNTRRSIFCQQRRAPLAANTYLSGDALLEYANGSIATIANGVTLTLVGTMARVADAADTTSDSALTGLATIAGSLRLLNGSTARITGQPGQSRLHRIG